MLTRRAMLASLGSLALLRPLPGRAGKQTAATNLIIKVRRPKLIWTMSMTQGVTPAARKHTAQRRTRRSTEKGKWPERRWRITLASSVEFQVIDTY